jgi:UDP-sugar diphosphatase
VLEIKDIEVSETTPSKKTYAVSYRAGKKKICREVTKTLDTVKVLLYHEEKSAFLITKQFRPLVYINHPESAIRYELCGGRADKEGLSYEELAREEVLEECGYKVDKLEKVTTFTTVSKMTLFFATINESMRIDNGGGLEDEAIELVFVPLEEAKAFMFDESKPKRPALMFSFCWFLSDKMDKISV